MRRHTIAIFAALVLLLNGTAASGEEEACISFGAALVRLLSAGLTESVAFELEPYTVTAMSNENATRAGIILMHQGEAACVIVADRTSDQDGFLQYVSTQIIPEENQPMRAMYAVWVEERLKRLQDGLILADTLGDYYCCVIMDGNVRACVLADVDYAGEVMSALIATK